MRPILLAMVLSTVSLAQTEHAVKAKWLADNSFSVRSIDPDDDDFTDLQFLKKVIGNARVVQLGDQTHGDGATIYARSRLVRFLHEQMGFDVLAWEGGFFDCEEMNEAIRSDMPIERAMRQGLHAPAAQSGQLRPLFGYIRSTMRTDHALRQTGLDVVDFLGDPSDPGASLRRLFRRLDSVNPDLASPSDRSIIEAIVNGKVRNLKATAEERLERKSAVTRVINRLSSNSAGGNSRATLFVQKALENVASLEEFSSRELSSPDQTASMLYRDEKMGETLLWLLNGFYREQKLMVVVGGGHAAHKIGALYAEAEKSSFKDYRTMGDVIHEHLGRDVYTIQFAAYQGKHGTPFRPAKVLPTPKPGSLEDLWHLAESKYAFLDLRSLPAGHWSRGRISARPFGYTEQEASWADHFDGFFYTDVMFPSTRDGVAPDDVRTKARKE